MKMQNTPLVCQNVNYFKCECVPKRDRTRQKCLLVLFGIVIGIINGFFGSGGGMLVVPVLCFVAKLDQKSAHATAIAIILPLCLVSTIVYAVSVPFQMDVVLWVVIGVIVGSAVGALLLKRLSNNALTFLFYALMLFAGIKMIVQ